MRYTRTVTVLMAFAAWPCMVTAQTPEQEEFFLAALVNRYQTLDLAERYCRDRLKETRDELLRATFEWCLRADIPRMRGDVAAFQQAVEELRKRYPKHPRAASSRLDLAKSRVDGLAGLWDDALREADAARRKALLDQVTAEFDRTVRAEFTALIKDMNDLVENAPRDQFGQIKDPTLGELRNQSEFFWILALMRLARFLDDQAGFEGVREKALHEALAAATVFVDRRADYFVLRYLAQLQKGLCHAALGRPAEAAQELEILLNITPPIAPPWDAALVLSICEIRLDAYLHTIRACNQAGQYARAAGTSDKLMAQTRPPFNLVERGPKERSLQGFWVEAQLESGVALAGVGRPAEAAARIQALIEKYRLDRSAEARHYVQKARSALARMVLVAGPMFPPTMIAEAGQGLKGEYNWTDARRVFQAGLAAPMTPAERAKYLPIFLNEVGETSLLSGRAKEALLAYLTALRIYAEDSADDALRQKLANNAYATALQLEDTEKNAAFTALFAEAQDFFERWGNPEQVLIQQLADAIELKNADRFDAARAMLLALPETYDSRGEQRPFRSYWRARAEAADCLYQLYRREETKDPAKRETALKELQEVLARAQAAQQEDGRAAAAYYRARIHLDEGTADEGMRFLAMFVGSGPLAGAETYRDSALYRYACALAETQKRNEARAVYGRLRRDFPDSVETARAAGHLFEYYHRIEDACAAALYGREYLGHSVVQAMETDEELLFEIGKTMADCADVPGISQNARDAYLAQARGIFEKVYRPDSPREKRIAAGTGLVKIYRVERVLDRALQLAGELLMLDGSAPEDVLWVVPLRRERMRIHLTIAVEWKDREGFNPVAHLRAAEEDAVFAVNATRSHMNIMRPPNGTPAEFQEAATVFYRYYLDLLKIWRMFGGEKLQRAYYDAERVAEDVRAGRLSFLPGDLAQEYVGLAAALGARVGKSRAPRKRQRENGNGR